MKRRRYVRRIMVFIILLQTLFLPASANEFANASSVKDSTLPGEKAKIHSLYAGTGYGSNMVYLGATMSHDSPFDYGSLSYGFRDHLYLSATGYSLSEFKPFLAFYSLDLSFNHTFNSWFDVGLSLSRYNVTESLTGTIFSSFTYANATLGIDWKILYTQLSFGELLGEESRFYLQARNSRYFETPSFAKDKAFFSFDPYVNLLFGTIVSVETVEGTTTTISPGYKPWKKPSQGSYTRYTEKFGLLEIDLGLPVAFSYDLLSVEVEPGYVIPLYSESGTSGMKGFLFLISAYIRIF
jgi:hypothetical protein